MLYIVRFLHQTTTYEGEMKTFYRCISSVSYIKPQRDSLRCLQKIGCISSVSYIKPQRKMIKFEKFVSCISSVSYIKPQPLPTDWLSAHRCISSVSYIKPQLLIQWIEPEEVVYRPFPTSNHNGIPDAIGGITVVYRPFPTSNHNSGNVVYHDVELYIVRFLHQTTTYRALV